MKKNIYKIENSIELLKKDKSTLFLDAKEFNEIKYKLKKDSYNVFLCYPDSEKVILYKNVLPSVSLFKINSYKALSHPMILGSILGLNIDPSYLGDIIIDNDNYYFYILSSIKEFIKSNLIMIGNNSVSIEEIDINTLNNYKKEYETNKIIVSSLRIDTVIARIIKTNRDKVLELIKNKNVILNYDVLTKNSYILKPGDVFSIRKYGKYKFDKVIGNTKKDNYVIEYLKYK